MPGGRLFRSQTALSGDTRRWRLDHLGLSEGQRGSAARLLERQHHFFKAQLLASQFADLEEPADAIVIDVEIAPSIAVRQIVAALVPARAKAS